MTGISAPVTLQSGAIMMVNVTEMPTLGSTETWEMYNFTVDAHPIHLHLVRFEVVDREVIGVPGVMPPQPWETGFKDTVIAYPGQITRVKALFDIPGLYVWHCHIVEHEDNEMMRPYVVAP
jgi:FtsP/CotA-like multicopper oxidase with cupredoxin domain